MTDILRYAAEPLSLSEPLRADGDAEVGDVVEDRSAISPFDAAAASLLGDQVTHMLVALSPRERDILRLRFGLDRSELSCRPRVRGWPVWRVPACSR